MRIKSKYPINTVAKFTADNAVINENVLKRLTKKYKIIALFGKSGAGKDTVQKWIVSNLSNINEIISCTTLPPRDNETDGIDYHFIDLPVFTQMVLDGKMLEATEFNNWFYGTTINSLDINKINVGTFNITGIECLLQDSRLDILPIYIVANDKERLLRSLLRESLPDCKEICRRFFADEKDFANIGFKYDYYLNCNDKDISKILEQTLIQKFIHGQN